VPPPGAAGTPINLRIGDPSRFNLTAGATVTVQGSVEGEDADIDFLLGEEAEHGPAAAGGGGGGSSGSSAGTGAYQPDLLLHVDSLVQQASGGEQEKSLLASKL
jgi:hypothetical protein